MTKSNPKVQKRTGEIVEFDLNRIIYSIERACVNGRAEKTEEQATKFANKVGMQVLEDLDNLNVEVLKIEDIQSIIINRLMNTNQTVAKDYTTYKTNRDLKRLESRDINKQVERLFNKNAQIVNENANKDSNVYNTQRDLTAGVVGKAIGLSLLPPHVAKAHEEGEIHYHDLDYSPILPMTNCCLIDFNEMLKNGFKIGNAEVESPKSIQTAAAQISQIVANVASSQYGGCSADRIDEILAPYAELNYSKHLKVAKEYSISNAEEYAKNRTAKDIYDAMQSLEYEVNTLFTSNGQTPFVTFGFGLGESWYAREIQKAILKVRIGGIGHRHATAIFPKLNFTLKRGLNLDKGDPNYDIKLLAIECATKRMYPDVLSYDMLTKLTGSFKSSMGCVEGEETVEWKFGALGETKKTTIEELWDNLSFFGIKTQPNGEDEYIDLAKDYYIKDSHTGSTNFIGLKRLIKNYNNSWIAVDLSNGQTICATQDHPFFTNRGRTFGRDLLVGDVMYHQKEDWDLTVEVLEEVTVVNISQPPDFDNPSYDVTTESDYFDVSGIVSHNCRSFLQGWKDENGLEVNAGRMNLGVVTINLPRIGIEAHGDKDLFWSILDKRIQVVGDALKFRIKRCKEALPVNAPILFMNGAFGNRLDVDGNVDDLFNKERSTVSFGYIGLYEAATSFYGNQWEHNPEAKQFTLDILKRIREYTDKWTKEQGYYYSIYGTPSESLTDRFCRLDTEKFGVIPDITDKEYYTNSFHYDIRKAPTPFEKLDFEKDYPVLASGGFIHYCEYPVLQQNPKALEAVWDFAYDRIGYLGTNTPIDKCYKCGFEGDFEPTEKGFKCPDCGNHDPKYCDVVKRTCGLTN